MHLLDLSALKGVKTNCSCLYLLCVLICECNVNILLNTTYTATTVLSVSC